MFCSTIIPTVARPVLSRAVQSVLDQRFEDEPFEVIVVNDSGQDLPPAPWQQDPRVRVISTQRRERSVARNTGAAVARGRYLHFLDDDDWLMPGALQGFYALTKAKPEADWLYGSSQLVDRQGKALIQLHHELDGNCFVQVMAGEWLPLQSSLIKASAFFAAGGFNPFISSTEDVDLCRRIVLRGPVAGMRQVVATIGMGEEGSTTNPYRAQSSEGSRRAREAILHEPGAWRRLRASAKGAEWQGRVVRIYFTSCIWNLRHRFIFTAGSRFFAGFFSLLTAGRWFVSSGFWKGITRSYTSHTFIKGFQEAGLPVQT